VYDAATKVVRVGAWHPFFLHGQTLGLNREML
jgi:hypothetical protein